MYSDLAYCTDFNSKDLPQKFAALDHALFWDFGLTRRGSFLFAMVEGDNSFSIRLPNKLTESGLSYRTFIRHIDQHKDFEEAKANICYRPIVPHYLYRLAALRPVPFGTYGVWMKIKEGFVTVALKAPRPCHFTDTAHKIVSDIFGLGEPSKDDPMLALAKLLTRRKLATSLAQRLKGLQLT